MRLKYNMMVRFFLIGLIFFISCNTPKSLVSTSNPPSEAKNVIFLIADGMGVTQVSAGLFMNNNSLHIERFPVVGLHKPYASDNLITDSAAGATAFSCGVKTYNGAIGVNQDTISVKTIMEECIELGYKAGLVASSSITHATPASFAAHNRSRSNMEEIASDMSSSGVHLMIGGGKGYFDRRTIDERNLSEEMTNNGYIVTDFINNDIINMNLSDYGDKFVYFTADKEPLTAEAGRDYLIPASQKSIDFLNTNAKGDGFFLMIEGSQVDWAGHANNFSYLISEFLEFDQVVKAALDFAEKDGNTLVVLTGDHETGGLSINYDSEMNNIVPAYTTDGHSGTLIPVFAYGPGAELFSGIYENTAIYNKLKQALGMVVIQ